jgi:hypothetical protein
LAVRIVSIKLHACTVGGHIRRGKCSLQESSQLLQ